MYFFIVDRIPHTGNGMTIADFLGNQTAEKIQLIRTGYRDQDICLF